MPLKLLLFIYQYRSGKLAILTSISADAFLNAIPLCIEVLWSHFRVITSGFSFRYNKQLIAQLVGRHKDLSRPENSCLPLASPSGDMNFLGGTNLNVSRQTGQ